MTQLPFPSIPVWNVKDVTENFEHLQVEFNPVWKQITEFKNAWENFEAGRKAEYRKLLGNVYIRGVIKTGETGKPAFELPEHYRPKEAKDFAAVASGGAADLNVTAAGIVSPVNMGGEVKTFVILDPICFSVD